MQYKRPFYKKWWFWLVIAVITVFTNLGSGNNDETQSTHHSTEARSAKVEKSRKQKAAAEKRKEEKARKLAAERKKAQAKKLAAKKAKLRKKQLAQKRREKRAIQLAQKRRRAQKRQLALQQKQKKQLLAQKKAQARQAAANDRNSRTVYVAPTSGRRYHFDPNCRGLRPANGNITQMPLKEAISEGYTLCKWED